MSQRVDNLIYKTNQAWATLKKKPGFIASVVTTMGLTLGALLCILTLAYVLLIKPLPYPEQNSLYTVEHQLLNKDNQVDGRAFTYPNLIHLYKNQLAFEQAALMYFDADVLQSKATNPTLQQAFITPEWFSLLNASMAIGRSFSDSEALNTHNPVAIISYQTWQNEFSLDKDILTKKIVFSDISYRIVGVLSKEFIEPELLDTGMKSAVFLPWDYNSISPSERKKWGNDDDGMKFLGKLKQGLSQTQVNDSLTKLINENWQENVAGHKFFNGWGIGIKIHSLTSVLLAGSEKTIYLLLAGVLGLVLIACANIANLFISRTAEQQRQLAIHAAVGASKKQLFTTLLAESSLLMFCSSVVALIVASSGFVILQEYLANFLPRVNELSINLFTLTCALVLVILLALFFARLSTKMINYHALNNSLQSSGKGSGIQVSRKIRHILITSQVAIVGALVFINIALFKDATTTINEPMGFEPDNISWVVLSTPSYANQKTDEAKKAAKVADVTQIRNKIAALPQIEQVSQALAPMYFRTLAATVLGTNQRFSVKAKDIDHGYFQMINQPLIEGRNFIAADIKDDNYVIIINDVYAKQLNPTGSALGIKFENGDTVIGVVKGIKVPNTDVIPARFYYPASPDRNVMLVKIKEGQTLPSQQVVSILNQVNKQFKLFSLTTLNERISGMLFTEYTTLVTSGLLALITLFLSAVGLYGILSYSTQMRRFELGTRMAIGAKRKDLIGLVIKDNAKSILMGIALSLIALFVIIIGFNESLTDYINLQLVPVLLVTLGLIALISLAACYLPLRAFINKPAIYSLKGSD